MDTNQTGPQASFDAHPHACPHCGSGCGVADPMAQDPMAQDWAMLTELASLSMRMVRMMTLKAEAAGDLNEQEARVLDIVSRSTRRTFALKARLLADSKKTPEERAAERAERAAEAERQRLSEKRTRLELGVKSIAKRESAPSDHEKLLTDLNERLLDPRIDTAMLHEDVTTVALRVLKEVGITPKQEIWSDALMAHEISEASAALARYEAERAAGEAAMAAGEDWRVGIEFSPPPGVETKIGRFTFGPNGEVVREDPPDTPQAAWPLNVFSGRDPPDSG
jgi:hypothetical protein